MNISIVIPGHNEKAVLPRWFEQLTAAVTTRGMNCKPIGADDDSLDNPGHLGKRE